SVNSNQTSSLYAINLSTALATKCYDFDGTMQFADLYLISSGANEKAPAPVTNLYAKPYASDYSRLQVSFTMPTTTNDGLDNLSGNLTYNIKIDGDIKKTGTAQPGANVSELIDGLELGRTVVAVFASNNEGESVEMSVDAWVGLDLPSAPTDVVLTASGNRMTLNWTAPTDGEHGGYLDNATLAYNIVRYPDNAVVATGLKSTSFTEVLSVSQLTVVNYGVVAVTKDGESAETMSNNISIGESITPPYHEPFDTETALDYYTILDNNNDTYSWRWYDVTMECPYMGTTMDDWLLTPPIKLETGKE
ncbi:MAG: fibronectin type III domain-containing protein, partial [Prevotella sp.]|nr:fibronectin type III domain-containing protein [Prevotella sp.]